MAAAGAGAGGQFDMVAHWKGWRVTRDLLINEYPVYDAIEKSIIENCIARFEREGKEKDENLSANTMFLFVIHVKFPN